MLVYTLRRLFWVVPILFGVTLIVFLLLNVVPGDPARMLTGFKNPGNQSLINIQDRFDLGKPVYRRYIDYLIDLSRGDLGVSFRRQRPVSEVIADTLPYSLKLAGIALLLELLIAVPAGALSALRPGSWFDRLSLGISAVMVAMPVFLLGLVFQLIFAVHWRLLPVAGGDHGLKSYVLPAGVLAIIAAAYLTRVVRSTLLDVLAKDYITAAEANGFSTGRILLVYALKPALPPIVNMAGLHFGFLIGSAVATEVVFNLPGIGRQLFAAVMDRDRPIVIGITLVLAVIFILVNLAVDIIHAWLNPRIRERA